MTTELHRVGSRGTALLLVAAITPSLASQFPYGHGTPGSSGTRPTVSCGQPFIGNSAFSFEIDRAKPHTPAALLISTVPAATTFGGSSVWVGISPGQLLFSVPLSLGSTGSGGLPATLVGLPQQLVGVEFYVQGIVADVPSSGALIATTNGLEVQLTGVPSLFLGVDAHTTSLDPFAFLDPRTLALQASGAGLYSDAINGAVFSAGGRKMFVSSQVRRWIQVADLTSTRPAWSRFAQLAAGAVGVAHDRRNRRLYTMSGTPGLAMDFVVFDADPTSPGYGTELHRLAGISSLVHPHEWAISAGGNRAVIFAGGSNADVMIIDTDPGSSRYLQIVERPTVPGLQPPLLNNLRRLHLSNDGEVLFALLTVGFSAMPNGIHRYHIPTKQWFDHNPGTSGTDPIGPFSSPPAPRATTTDLAVARDGSFAVLTDDTAIVRVDFDRDDFSTWRATRLVGSWTPSRSLNHIIMADGLHALLLGPTSSPQDSWAALVDVRTGKTVATTTLPGIPWTATMAER